MQLRIGGSGMRFLLLAVMAIGVVPIPPTDALGQAGLDLQERCAKQAENIFYRDGWNSGVTYLDNGRDVLAHYESHYNAKLGGCFMLLETVGVRSNNLGYDMKNLSDAYEDRTYADYAWAPRQGKEYSDVLRLFVG